MASVPVPCVCISDVCGHREGTRCGRPVRVKLKYSVALGEANFSEESETELCDECWATITRHYPQLFRNP